MLLFIIVLTMVVQNYFYSAQLDQFRAASLDGPVRPVVPDPERAGHGRLRCGAGGRDLVSLSPARGAHEIVGPPELGTYALRTRKTTAPLDLKEHFLSVAGGLHARMDVEEP